MMDRHFIDTMELIVASLKERGYNPYAQLFGYISYNEPAYITSHNNARNLIQTLDQTSVKKYVLEMDKK